MKFGRFPIRITLMAGRAASRRTHMVSMLASGFCPVMTTGAVGSTGKSCVISLGTAPGGIGLVTTFAACRSCDVTAVFAGGCGAVVTTRAGCCHRHVGMKLCRQPIRISCLMASCATV